MKLCSRCKKRPAVVFLADASTPGSEPQGLCLVCAKELGINLIDADHFCTENVIVPVLADKLAAAFTDVEFAISSVHVQTARFF